MQKDVILTPEGLQKLKDELEELSGNRRRQIADRIKEAREFGDISENSEYDDAKNEQAMLEQRIMQLQERLRAAQVVDAKDVSTDAVGVGSAEADPANNRLSNESPVGQAVLGHKKGEVVEVAAPSGSIKLQIVSIKAA